MSLVPLVPGSGWIPAEWVTLPVPRTALPPGTGCHSQAGDAVPGCSALHCDSGWGGTSLSLSSPPSLKPIPAGKPLPASLLPEHGPGVRQTPARPSCGCWGSHLPPRCPRSCSGLAWGRHCAVAARLFCVSGQVSGACFTVGLSQSPQVMPRSQEHSTPATGRVLAPRLAPGRVEAPLPQERALEAWPWAEAGPAPAWGWTEIHGHVVMAPGCRDPFTWAASPLLAFLPAS